MIYESTSPGRANSADAPAPLGRIQAFDLELLPAGALHDQAHNPVALLDDLDRGPGGRRMVRAHHAGKTGGEVGMGSLERRGSGGLSTFEEWIHEAGGVKVTVGVEVCRGSGFAAGGGAEEASLGARLLFERERLSVILWFDSDSGASPSMGRVSA